VERLRWILRQQREHFLPLKVIKGRLENGMTDSDAPTPQLFEMGDPPPQRESQVMLVGAHGTAEATREASLQALAPVAAAASAGGRTPNRADSHVLASRETGPAAGRATGPSPRGSTHGTTPGARQPASGPQVAGTRGRGCRQRRSFAKPPPTQHPGPNPMPDRRMRRPSLVRHRLASPVTKDPTTLADQPDAPLRARLQGCPARGCPERA